MRNPFIKLILLSVLFIPTLSCEDAAEMDLEAPVLELISPTFASLINHSDGNLEIKAVGRDASGIEEAYLFIHAGFDGHLHDRRRLVQWVQDYYFDGNGQSLLDISINLEMPEDMLGGPYHVEMQAVDIHGNVTSHPEGNSIASQVLIRRDDQAIFRVDKFEKNDGKLIIEGFALPSNSDISFVSITLSNDSRQHLGYISDEQYIFEAYFGLSAYRSYPSGINVQGDPIPFEADGSVDLAKIIGELNLNEFSNQESILLKMSLEDEDGNVDVFQQRIAL